MRGRRFVYGLGCLGIAMLFGAVGCTDNAVPKPTDSAVSQDLKADGSVKVDGPVKTDTLVTPDLPVSPCPSAVPSASTACPSANEGLICQYGTDPTCLTTATCTAKVWTVSSPKCVGPDPSCPATRAAAADQVCSPKDAYCVYSGLVCSCTNCTKYPIVHCSGPLKWKCDAPPADPKCPAARPLLGTACPVENQFCEYGCEPDVSRRCTGSIWVKASAPGGCPVSTRRAKEQIHYLGATALDRVAERALSLRLATYRYRDPALRGKRHLGFILEDSPQCIAADMAKGQVDLYSYASMALALAQRQAREIATLKKQVAALHARLRHPR